MIQTGHDELVIWLYAYLEQRMFSAHLQIQDLTDRKIDIVIPNHVKKSGKSLTD